MLLALDPGKEHFAWSVFSSRRLLATGMLHDTVHDFKDTIINKSTSIFIKEMARLLDKYGITEVVAERYMVRGGMAGGRMGASAEFISYMLGITAKLCRERKIKLYLITSAVWKNYCYREYDFPKKTPLPDVFGFKGLSKNFSTVPIKEHQYDSCGIGLYWMHKTKKLDLYKQAQKKLVLLWRKGKPTSKVHLKSYRKVKVPRV